MVRLRGLPSGGVLLSPSLLAVLCPAPTPSRLACTRPRRASPVPRWTLPAFRVLYAGGFLTAALPRASPLPWPSPFASGFGSLLAARALASAGGTHDAADFASCY